MKYQTLPGKPHPLGATVEKNGVNFSVFSEHATGMELLIFDHPTDLKPVQTISLDPDINRRYTFWHLFVKGLKPGAGYAYRASGPFKPEDGLIYNSKKVLTDPYAKATTHALWDRQAACNPDDNLSQSLRSVVVGDSKFNWEGDKPLGIPKKDTIIYEMHPKGFTASPNSNVKHPGTFLGLIEKIPYLKNLGITAVELMPINEYDATEVVGLSPEGKPLTNYWGYSPIGYFSLHPGYCVSKNPLKQLDEFRLMVKELHRAGIEVILDMVFNHTGEGNTQGPVINFKGLDNSVYYHLNPQNRADYLNFSGCGNTLNCNHPIVAKMIRESLEYWVRDMHVDGFRLDEGAVLSRNHHGTPETYPRVLWDIELSDTLAETKLIAEAWDAAGLYELGSFPGFRWSEWNGRYRDELRRFIRGELGLVGNVAQRLSGSADLYQNTNEQPVNSVNFITCHDGFTMYDLVSYQNKHNEPNGEQNRDGINENFSSNNGYEGETQDKNINNFRFKQLKNMFVLLLISQGMPLLLYGDEIARTQKGNNNPYCQDNDISWFDWDLAGKNKSLTHFISKVINFRRTHPHFRRQTFFKGKKNRHHFYDIEWHGCSIHEPGWNDPNSRVLSMTLGGESPKDDDIFVAINLDDKDLNFEIPERQGKNWQLVVNTAAQSPNDFLTVPLQIKGHSIPVAQKSIVILKAR